MTERPAEVGDLRLATVCVNATDMDRAADFWCAALGYRRPEKIVDNDQFAKLQNPDGAARRRLRCRRHLTADRPPRHRAPVGPRDREGARRRFDPAMTVKLNKAAVDHAKELVRKGQTAKAERDDWSEHAPTADEQNA
jgi:catechol 2,3-dioxygenase-like lactoylglutathione lyase family enzyme